MYLNNLFCARGCLTVIKLLRMFTIPRCASLTKYQVLHCSRHHFVWRSRKGAVGQIWWSTYGSNVSESRDLNQVRKERHCLETNMMMIFNLSSPQNTFLKKKNHIMWKKSFFEIIYLVDLIILRMWRKCPCADQFVKERKIFIFDLHVRPDHQ